MATTAQPLTAENLLRLSRPGRRYELVRGELKEMPPAGNIHGKLTMRIAGPLFEHVEKERLGVVYAAETGFKLASDPDTVRGPDIAFISQPRLEEVGESDGFWPGAPDLAVEVISQFDTYTEVEEKVFDWLEAGTRMVVVVNPRKRAVTVYRSLSDISVLKESDFLDGADVVPGWRYPLSNLFS